MLLLVALINLPLRFFFIYSLSPRIVATTKSSSFLDIYNLRRLSGVRSCASSSISLSFGSSVRLPSLSVLRRVLGIYLTMETVQVFIPLMKFLLKSFLSKSFPILLRYSFLAFFISVFFFFMCPLPIFPRNLPYLQVYWCFPNSVVLLLLFFLFASFLL